MQNIHHVKCTFAHKSQLAKKPNTQATVCTLFGAYGSLFYAPISVYNRVTEKETRSPINPISEEDIPMTLLHHYINNFIYPTDNIPDHRSRRFGCCPCLMAVRECASFQQKSRIRGATRTRQVQNQPTLNKSILPFHHNMPAHAKQAGKGSSQKFTPDI